ncbi:MAG: hypothetical protein JXA57_19270 [Armatimonadetes bacterium]|nr:hypothetical protein [Armatimonadota bacterium]
MSSSGVSHIAQNQREDPDRHEEVRGCELAHAISVANPSRHLMHSELVDNLPGSRLALVPAAAPFGACGVDPTADALECARGEPRMGGELVA